MKALKTHPTASAWALGLILTLAVLATLEIGSRLYEMLLAPRGPSPELELSSSHPYTDYDTRMGGSALPGASTRVTKRLGEQMIYEVNYNFDRYRRRVTPGQQGTRAKYVLFMGDSFTLGEGVEDDQTMPSHFARAARGYRAYNYGFQGWSPAQMYALLKQGSLRGQVVEKDGALVFMLIGHHIDRVVGRLFKGILWNVNSPCYEPGAHGKLEHKGRIADCKRASLTLYKALTASHFLERFNIAIPPRLTDRDYEVATTFFIESRELYRQNFGNDRFYVAVHPMLSKTSEPLVKRLREHGIRILDYSDVPVDSIPYDGHPSSKGHETIARLIARDLAK